MSKIPTIDLSELRISSYHPQRQSAVWPPKFGFGCRIIHPITGIEVTAEAERSPYQAHAAAMVKFEKAWAEYWTLAQVTLWKNVPAEPLGVQLIKKAISEIERNVCLHEETHRGGAIWEICDTCGKKWADDQGGRTKEATSEILKELKEYVESLVEISEHGEGQENYCLVCAAEPGDPCSTPDGVEHGRKVHGARQESNSAFIAATEYTLKHQDLEFLACWFHGNFDAIRKEWPDAPEGVFIGADPLYKPTPQVKK